MDVVRVGVVGSGYWGPNLIRNFAEIPEAEVVSVADLREDRRQHIASRYPGIQTTPDYRDFFTQDLDAVVIATPPATHYSLARECLERGLHVLVEKPFTLNSRHAEELVRLAEERGLTLMAGHTFEYNSAVEALKDIINSGELGEIFYISTLRLNLGLFQPDLNVLWDLAPHDISIVRYLLDAEPLKVNASGASYILPHVYDIAFLCLEFPGSVRVHCRVSWLDPRKVREVTVVGSKKMAIYDDVSLSEKIRIYDKRVTGAPYTDTFGEFQLQYHHGNVVIPNIRFGEPLRQECTHFLHCVRNGEEPRSSGRSGWSIVKILEAAEKSLRNGNESIAISWFDEEQAQPAR